MFSQSKLSVLSLVLCAALAPAAKADGFGFSYSANTKHGAITVGYSSAPSWAPGYRVRNRCARWIPGHYETVRERVWVPGRVQRVWFEPAYEWRRDACGRAILACVSVGHYEMVRQPGRYEYRDAQVWVAGCWRS